jgi:hypothetical protein
MNDDNLQQINQRQIKKIKSKIQAVAKWSRSPQAAKTANVLAIALDQKKLEPN